MVTQPAAGGARGAPWRRVPRRTLIPAALVLLAGALWLAREFPGWLAVPRSGLALLRDVHAAPVRMVEQPLRYVRSRAATEAVVLFIRASGVPSETEERLVQMARGERFTDVTVPFIWYLYELYGATRAPGAAALDGLTYEAAPPSPPAAEGEEPVAAGAPGEGARDGSGLAPLVRRSLRLRKHVATALRLFDALFLRVRPGTDRSVDVRERYDPAAYEEVKAVVRAAASEMLKRGDDATEAGAVRGEYQAAFGRLVEDDQRLSALVEFLSDFIRELSESWLGTFVRREERKDQRRRWVLEQIERNRRHAVADYARGRAERRLAVHLVVDGLQGLLLEGLAQLSSGRPDGAAARYVRDLVRLHRDPRLDPARYGSALPPALGRDVRELARDAPDRPDYLRTFKRRAFSPRAQAVVVHVASVDTPSISVRNLPIAFSGHAVAGRFGTGIPNFSYLDRRAGRGFYFWGSDVLYMRDIFANREERIPGGGRREGPGARTLFERLWRYNTVSGMATLDTGALEQISSEVGLALGELKRDFVEQTLVLRFRRRAAVERELNARRRWLVQHRNLSGGRLAAWLLDRADLATFREHALFLAEHEDEGLPDYFLWYDPWPDHFAHGRGPYSDAIIGYRGEYDRLDFFLGRIVDAYASVPTPGGSSYAERTLFGVVSDHGLVYAPQLVSTDEELFGAMEREGLRVSRRKLTHDEGGLPAIHRRGALKPARPFDAVVGSTAGGSYIIDLFDPAGLAGDDSAWRRHPDYHDLRRHRLLSGQTVDWIEQVRRLGDKLDLALVRERGPEPGRSWPGGVESVVRVVTAGRGEARIARRRGGPGGRVSYRYEVLGERDPLGLVEAVREYLIAPGGPPVEQARDSVRRCIDAPEGCAEEEWARLLSFTLRPDVVRQYVQIYDSERAGTLNLFPARHVGMNTSVPGRHAGEVFGEKNGTQLYWGAGLRRARLQTARNGSLPVTLYHWLAGDQAFHAADPATGVPPAEQLGFPSLLDDPAFAPLR